MGLFIAKEDIGNQVIYYFGDAEGRIINIVQGDTGIGFDYANPTIIEGISCIRVTYSPTLTGATIDRLNVLINNLGFEHGNIVNYTSPPDIIIFAVNDSLTTPTGSPVKFGISLPPGSPSPLLNNVCLIYNASPCLGKNVLVNKEGGGTTNAYAQHTLYYELAHCYKYVTQGDITDDVQAATDENEMRDSQSQDHCDANNRSIACDTSSGGTTTTHCFPFSTLVLTPSGWVRIGNLQVGDVVISYHKATGRKAIRRVTRRLDHAPTQIWELTTQDASKSISTTASHPFLTQRGWIFASRLKEGDELITLRGRKRFNSVRKTDRFEAVHNIFTTVEHTFIVQGHFVVHNFAYLRTLRSWWHRVFVDWKVESRKTRRSRTRPYQEVSPDGEGFASEA